MSVDYAEQLRQAKLNAMFGTPTARGMTRSVWGGKRIGGQAGTGTHDDPYDCSTAVKFDTLRRTLASTYSGQAVAFHLFEDEYETAGTEITDGDGTRGANLPPNWRIYGVGKPKIKLASWPTLNGSPYPYGITVLGCAGDGVGCPGAELADLIIDCNAAVTPYNNNSVGAVTMHGDNCSIYNLTALAPYGSLADGNECFAVEIGTPVPTDLCYHGHIEKVRVQEPRGDYTVAIFLDRMTDSEVTRCDVIGTTGGTVRFNSGISVSGTGNQVHHNEVRYAHQGMYFEQANDAHLVMQHLKVSHNNFRQCFRGVNMNGNASSPVWRNLEFDHNLFEVTNGLVPSGGGEYDGWAFNLGGGATGGTKNLVGVRLINNTFWTTDEVSNGVKMAIGLQHTDGCRIEGNTIRALLAASNVTGALNLRCFGNRNETNGTVSNVGDT